MDILRSTGGSLAQVLATIAGGESEDEQPGAETHAHASTGSRDDNEHAKASHALSSHERALALVEAWNKV
jgi:hypothetical protein